MKKGARLFSVRRACILSEREQPTWPAETWLQRSSQPVTFFTQRVYYLMSRTKDFGVFGSGLNTTRIR